MFFSHLAFSKKITHQNILPSSLSFSCICESAFCEINDVKYLFMFYLKALEVCVIKIQVYSEAGFIRL